MKRSQSRILAILAAAATLSIAGLSTSGCVRSSSDSARLPTGNDCFSSSRTREWRALDDRNLIVWSHGHDKAYRVSLAPGCQGIGVSHSLRFDSRGDRICGFGGRTVATTGGGRCVIVAVKKLDALEIAELVPPRGTPVSVKTTILYPDEETAADDTPD